MTIKTKQNSKVHSGVIEVGIVTVKSSPRAGNKSKCNTVEMLRRRPCFQLTAAILIAFQCLIRWLNCSRQFCLTYFFRKGFQKHSANVTKFILSSFLRVSCSAENSQVISSDLL